MIAAGTRTEYAVWSTSVGSTARSFARSSVSLRAPVRSSHCQVPLPAAGVTTRIACGGSLSGRAKLKVIPVVRAVAGITSVHSSSIRPHCRAVLSNGTA